MRAIAPAHAPSPPSAARPSSPPLPSSLPARAPGQSSDRSRARAPATASAPRSTSKSFTLSATNLLSNKFGLFFYGTNGPQQLPFQGGELCVAPPIRRLAVQSTGGTPGQCDGALALDFNQVIASGGDPQLVWGAQVAAQAWTRDPGDPFATNLTSARLFTISP